MLVDCCGGQIILRISSDIFIFNLGILFKGLFWERYILKGRIAFEGHWGLQSWTLDLSMMNEMKWFLDQGPPFVRLGLAIKTWSWQSTLFYLISVGYYSELYIAITLYWHYSFFYQLTYIIFFLCAYYLLLLFWQTKCKMLSIKCYSNA